MRVDYNTPTRLRNRKPPITISLICTDDYGDMALAECRYTKERFRPEQGIVRGSLVPQAKIAHLDGPNSAMAHQKSVDAWNESEANCNTCVFLVREKGPKVGGLLYGICSSPKPNYDAHPYYSGSPIFAFAPDDWQGMPCWTPRT